jgi:hypothetical protein
LDKLKDSEDINRAWENIKENIKTSAKERPGQYELQQLNARISIECLG